MFQHLLVPVDGTALSQRAIDTSIGLARKLGASITAFIAEPTAPPPVPGYAAVGYVRLMEEHDRETTTHATRILHSFESQAKEAGVPFEGMYVHSDHVVPAILDTAHERGCDLIVMATHIHGVFGELLSSSHAKGVMARGNLPVLVVH
jgi:nucleotide-binding universal stress UspA family protein